jgi:hypothetical protein
MLWNELSYEDQIKVMNLIEDLLLRQTHESMQDGLVAALNELELWSNSPCETIPPEEPFIAQAHFVKKNTEWDKFVSSLVSRKIRN